MDARARGADGQPVAMPVRVESTDDALVDACGSRWHVRRAGSGGPVVLLLHGTGSASTSWRELIPRLAGDFILVAPDLPGHGRTSPLASSDSNGRSSLPRVASAVAGLMRELALAPDFIVGHSAGAAISAQMALSEFPAVRRLAWIGAALKPFDGLAGAVAPTLARLLSRSVLLPRLAAWRAGSDTAVRRLIAATGSTLDARGVEAYAALLRRPSHVAGALAMMAGWDLAPLQRALPSIAAPVLLLHGSADRTVPAWQSDDAASRLPSARVVRLAGAGHLAHEEQAAQVAAALMAWFAATGNVSDEVRQAS